MAKLTYTNAKKSVLLDGKSAVETSVSIKTRNLVGPGHQHHATSEQYANNILTI